MPNKGLSKDEIEQLKKYDSPTVCNVIELFDVRPRDVGYMNEHVKCCFPEMPPMVGYASTAMRRCASAPAVGVVQVNLEEQLESFEALPGPAVVVYQDLDEPTVAATFGDIMCKSYKTFGAVGIVTSGSGRDLDQVRALDFPAFTDGSISSHGYGYTAAAGVPVHVGGITILPGDLLYGDCNGITTIPNDIASEVVDCCAEYAAAEAVVLDYLDQRDVTPKGAAEAQNECKRRLAELSERVRR
jgi:4-hydroxy-4-methyl-2-oxoglutarate aldolase